MSNATLSSIYRYPVKGLSGEQLPSVDIEADAMLPFDRVYAIENGSRDFDKLNPKHFPKQKFLQLMTNEALAGLDTRFDSETQTLKIMRAGKQVAAGNLAIPIGRQLIEQFLSAYLGDSARGTPRIVSAANHHFADVPDDFISLINLASVADLERIIGAPVNPLRFRANFYVEGWPAWHEADLVGSTLEFDGGARFLVSESITRCAAINVDPETGMRDMHIPRTLEAALDRASCGLYLTAMSSGNVSAGSGIKTIAGAPPPSAGRNLGIR